MILEDFFLATAIHRLLTKLDSIGMEPSYGIVGHPTTMKELLEAILILVLLD